MSSTWACHYRKNTPGFANVWEPCESEVIAMLRCSDPFSGKNLSISFSGYTTGVPEATIQLPVNNNLYWYSCSTGRFAVQVKNHDATPCGNSYVLMTLLLTGVAGAGNQEILDTGFYVNNQGFKSGIFALPCYTGDSYISGRIFAYSGHSTGSYVFNTTLHNFYTPVITCHFSAASNNFYLEFVNGDYELAATGITETGIDGENYAVANSVLVPAINTINGSTVNLGNNFLHIRGTLLPSEFRKGHDSTLFSGGHPPVPTGISSYYDYSTEANHKLYLKVGINSNSTGYYLETSPMSILYWDGATWNSSLEQTPEVRSGTYYAYDIDSLNGQGLTSFRISGRRTEVTAEDFYSTELAQSLNLGGITAYADTADSGCGVSVRWEGPNFKTYEIEISGRGDVTTTTVTPATNWYYYHETPGSSCGKVYYYTVFVNEVPVLESNQVSGSGQCTLRKPVFMVMPRHLDEKNVPVPTEIFYADIVWKDFNIDPLGAYLTGIRTDYNGIVYNECINCENIKTWQDAQGAFFTLSTGHRNSMDYRLRLVYGNNICTNRPTVTCGSDIGNYHMVVPRKSANPSHLVAIRSTPITDVVLTWDGNCHEDPDLEYYSGNRRDVTTDAIVNSFTILGDYNTYTESYVAEGDWKYDIRAIGENPEFSNYKIYSEIATTTISAA